MKKSTKFSPEVHAQAAIRGITGAILAGGAGVRLGGRDKGLEPLAGRPLIARVVEHLRAQVDDVLIVANRHSDDYARYAPVVADAAPGFRGPLAGIAVALASASEPWVLVVPVDGPDLPAELAARLCPAAGGADAVVVHDGERRQPLYALYARALAASAAEALAHDLGVWQWQDAIGAREVDFAAQRAHFVNLNTFADFRAWEARQRG